MKARHFRLKAAEAREMSKSGEDPILARMLLDVAHDLEAEADLIDAEHLALSGGSPKPLPASAWRNGSDPAVPANGPPEGPIAATPTLSAR